MPAQVSSCSFTPYPYITPYTVAGPSILPEPPRTRKRHKSEPSIESINSTSATAQSTGKPKNVCRMTEHYCAHCPTSKVQIGLFGQQEAIDGVQDIEYICKSCDLRLSTQGGWLEVLCQACKGALGVISLRLLEKRAASTATRGQLDFYQFAECSSCHQKYRICSDCGGGGNRRTGKYRPHNLFAVGRKNCQLSHTRIGNQPILDYEVWTNEYPSKFLELEDDIKLLHEDYILTVNATSEVSLFWQLPRVKWARNSNWRKRWWNRPSLIPWKL